jgi:hypothetical protein
MLLRTILILSFFYHDLGIRNGLFPSDFLAKILYEVLVSTGACRMPCTFYLYGISNDNNSNNTICSLFLKLKGGVGSRTLPWIHVGGRETELLHHTPNLVWMQFINTSHGAQWTNIWFKPLYWQLAQFQRKTGQVLNSSFELHFENVTDSLFHLQFLFGIHNRRTLWNACIKKN